MKKYRWKKQLVERFERLADVATTSADGDSVTGKVSYNRNCEGPWLDLDMEIAGVPYEIVIRPVSMA